MGRDNGSTIIFSPRKVPAAGSVGSAGIRFSSNTSPGAPFLLFPELDIVFLLYDFHELGAGVPIELRCRWRNGAILKLERICAGCQRGKVKNLFFYCKDACAMTIVLATMMSRQKSTVNTALVAADRQFMRQQRHRSWRRYIEA